MFTKKEFLVVLVITFIVTMLWIIAEILHTRPGTPLNPKIQTLIQDINPEFDQETLKLINTKLNSLPEQPIFLPPPTTKPNSSTSSAFSRTRLITQPGRTSTASSEPSI